jgi:HupE/UreJ protein
LRGLGLPAHGLLLSLFGFNAGVELGQALVVALALPALALVRRSRWERRVIWSSSAAILLVGVVLFVERAFL